MPGCAPAAQLPPVEVIKSRELLQQLTEQADDQSLWEVGANCNFLIASARLGLRAACIGNLGDDIYGRYLLDNLQVGASQAKMPSPVMHVGRKQLQAEAAYSRLTMTIESHELGCLHHLLPACHGLGV